MIRTTAAPRTTVRLGAAAAVGIAGAFALAGCAAPATTDDTAAEPTSEATTGTDDTTTDGGASSGSYADGTYTADGSYATPESVETIAVTLTLEGDVVTAVEVVGDPQKAESERYQGEFIGGISDEVVGVALDDLSVDRVAGSSLTSNGFNEAVEAIKAEAAA